MPITKEQFTNEAFYRQRSSKKQKIFLDFLNKNKNKAFTTKEIAKEIYNSDDEKSAMKAYFVLERLKKKGLVEKKLPYWKIKEGINGLDKNKN